MWLNILMLVTAASASSLDKLTATAIGKTLVKEIVYVKQPVLETIVNVTSSKCDTIKKLLGVQYTGKSDDDHEPDLNQLSLKYVTPDLNISMNINAASRLLGSMGGWSRGPLVVFVHGFTDSPGTDSFGSVINGYLSRGFVNILALDGSQLIRWLYLRSTTYVRYMGEKLGTILADMVKAGLPAESIHLIGHSLGAHISGFAGKQFRKESGRRVGRVTGLDPAGPCFVQLERSLRLAAGDASYVDVIHTNGGVAGIAEAIGDADYFPNEGHQQPSCLLDPCSHSRSWQYYAESLTRAGELAFPAIRCDSWEAFQKGNCSQEISYMGFPSRPGTKGNFYLHTAEDTPFGLGEEGFKYKDQGGILKSILGK